MQDTHALAATPAFFPIPSYDPSLAKSIFFSVTTHYTFTGGNYNDDPSGSLPLGQNPAGKTVGNFHWWCPLTKATRIGLLQLAVTWYVLEGKLPTGTSKTKKIQIYLDEVALFWMSQWEACPPACTM